MKLFDIVSGKVLIHNDALGIPAFKTIWDTNKDKDLATKYISYIVLKNKYDSPYVQSMDAADIEPRLKKELFGNSQEKLPVEVLEAEKAYNAFNYTLTLQLLTNARKKLESISKYYAESLEDMLDEKKVKEILAGMGSLGNTIKSLDLLEASVRAGELNNSKIRGGGELNPFEIAK
jgi:hypothetical protein